MLKKKLGIITSGGGHLYHMLILKEVFKDYETFWVSFDKQDVNSAIKDEKKYYAYSPTNRNIKNLIKNFFLAIKILIKEKPNILISSGAGIAVPFFYVAKFMGAKLVYIEVYDKYEKLTLTARLVYPISNKIFVQWKELAQKYKKCEYIGSIF